MARHKVWSVLLIMETLQTSPHTTLNSHSSGKKNQLIAYVQLYNDKARYLL